MSKPKPLKPQVVLSVQLSKDVKDALEEMAYGQRLTLSKLVRKLLSSAVGLDEEEDGEKQPSMKE